MLTWIWSGIIHLVLGFMIGWVVFQRPQWATDALTTVKNWLKAKLGLN